MDSVDNVRSRSSSPGWRCGRTRVVTRGQIAAPGENYGGGPFGPQIGRVVPGCIPGCGSSSPRVLHRVIVAWISPDRRVPWALWTTFPAGSPARTRGRAALVAVAGTSGTRFATPRPPRDDASPAPGRGHRGAPATPGDAPPAPGARPRPAPRPPGAGPPRGRTSPPDADPPRGCPASEPAPAPGRAWGGCRSRRGVRSAGAAATRRVRPGRRSASANATAPAQVTTAVATGSSAPDRCRTEQRRRADQDHRVDAHARRRRGARRDDRARPLPRPGRRALPTRLRPARRHVHHQGPAPLRRRRPHRPRAAHAEHGTDRRGAGVRAVDRPRPTADRRRAGRDRGRGPAAGAGGARVRGCGGPAA